MDINNIKISNYNSEFFIPRSMEPDAEEGKRFLNSKILLDSIAKATSSPNSLFYISNVTEHFPKTTKSVNDMVDQAGLRIREASLFVANGSAKIQRLHCDALSYKSEICMLEARFSFYGLTRAPGLISWWGKDAEVVLETGPVIVDGKQVGTRAGYISEWSRKKLGWDQIPDPIHTVSTDIPSGFVRTNIPHTVFQGDGYRITISYMLVDKETGSPHGVWDRIRTAYG
jgi:hypothetical protein